MPLTPTLRKQKEVDIFPGQLGLHREFLFQNKIKHTLSQNKTTKTS